ncbi:MAG: glycoside hydrolase family 127 protein [Treponema sp.]|nr:glycoside hydrolase family 127 protein [Treponema sp.]
MDAEYRLIRRGAKKPGGPGEWKAVPYRAQNPPVGVRLLAGPVRELFDRNIANLKYCFSLPDYCEGEPMEFIRQMQLARTGRGWSSWLPASNEGRMLAGAAQALRWEEDGELRNIVDTIIARIKGRMREDGYYNYYPEEVSYALRHYPRNLHNGEVGIVAGLTERKNYDRVFWTRGLIAAHLAGNPDALSLARRMYDWFNAAEEFLPDLLLGANATNGLPGGPLLYHTPAGKAEDLSVSKRYLDQDYWMEALAEKQPLALSHYPGERPHCYDLLAIETLADEYRATGEQKYLDALLGGWELYRDNYKHPGGATAICEMDGPYPPKSYYITTGHNGETCGSVFWIWINHRLMQLYPGEERYAGEIEEAIVNIMLACRTERGHTRYHNRLQGKKEGGLNQNTCCEVSSTNLISSLPEYIYMTGEGTVYVNLFLNSELDHDGFRLRMETDFPRNGGVRIRIQSAGNYEIRIRIPAWVPGELSLLVNGKEALRAKGGAYAGLRRSWQEGDTIGFDLPFTLRTAEYTGFDQSEGGQSRYALYCGPVLLALTGDFAETETPRLALSPEEPEKDLIPRGELQFAVKNNPSYRFIPYYAVQDEVFTCFPVLG